MDILVDLDNVLADFELGFYKKWKEKFPDREAIHPEERNTFYLYDQYPEEYKEDISSIYYKNGFIENLPPIKKGLEVIRKMDQTGYNISICSSHFSKNPHSSYEKIKWVVDHLSRDFAKKTILTKDKTQIKADLLIDDRPKIHGKFEPSWQHIIFDRPYNQDIEDKLRINWSNWKKLSKFE